MSLAIVVVGFLSLTALGVVGAAAFVELRPVVRQYRAERRHKRRQYADETLRVYTTVRFARARQGDNTGAIASLLLGVLLLALGAWEWSRFDYGSAWHTVEGTVIAARAETSSESTRAQMLVEYRYDVGGQRFTAYWIDTPDALLVLVGGGDFETRFQPGAALTVWVHPLMPTFPSLGRVTLWYVVIVVGSGGFLLLSSGLTLAFARRPRRAFDLT